MRRISNNYLDIEFLNKNHSTRISFDKAGGIIEAQGGGPSDDIVLQQMQRSRKRQSPLKALEEPYDFLSCLTGGHKALIAACLDESIHARTALR